MNGIWKKLSALSVLALSLSVWACENAGEVTQPSALRPLDGVHRALEPYAQHGTQIISNGGASVGAVQAVIDQNGGTLSLPGRATLEVPAGAVSGPTTFTMRKDDGDYLYVALTATQNTTNDVGAAGFPVPLKLTFSFGDAVGLPSDLGLIRVYYLKADGQTEAQPSSVDKAAQTVTGEITHFSPYGAGWPE